MTNPRTVTRFIEQRVTLGQLFYDTVRELLGLVTKWDEIDAPIQAAYETAIAAVVEAVEDTRADEPPVQRIEPKPVAVKVDGADFVKELDALLRRASEQSGTSDIKFQPHSALIGDPALVDKLVTFGSPRPGFTVGLHTSCSTKARPVAKLGETVTAPLPPSAFPGAEPFIPSDS